jgi:uncharacterized protein (TIGR03382 family)
MAKIRAFSLSGLTVIGVAGLVVTAPAQTAFDDFSAGFGYDTTAGAAIEGSTYLSPGTHVPGGLYGEAMQFSVGTAGYLSDVILPIYDTGDAGLLDVAIVADSSNSPGHSDLASWVTPTEEPKGTNFAPTFLTGQGPYMAVGTYWLEVLPDVSTPNVFAAWYLNNKGNSPYTLGSTAFESAGNWSPTSNNARLGAFRIDLAPSATPEPFTLALGAVGVGVALRRRRASRRS